ncbi:hypothetical protein [Desulfogranum mediterraneum]|uniref:hypothetical protein n=1 Tax=Desulfogranum mediterraneum TaxID=160661 RepID=UPI0004284149|nr:hypothetical protein [Desulfogranum mediterraneum]
MAGCNVFNQEHQMLLVHFFGEVTASDLELQAVSVFSHPDFSASTKELINFSDVESFAADVDMERLAAIVKINKDQLERYPELKIAILAPDPLSFNLARIYQEKSRDHQRQGKIKIFTSKSEAVQWLGGKGRQWDLLIERVSTMCTI